MIVHGNYKDCKFEIHPIKTVDTKIIYDREENSYHVYVDVGEDVPDAHIFEQMKIYKKLMENSLKLFEENGGDKEFWVPIRRETDHRFEILANGVRVYYIYVGTTFFAMDRLDRMRTYVRKNNSFPSQDLWRQ